MNIKPNRCFITYLEESAEENDVLDIVIQGNDKLNFSSRVKDLDLIAISETLEDYAIYIEEVDLRYNHIEDEGAKALANLIRRSERLLGLNVQGNSINIEGA